MEVPHTTSGGPIFDQVKRFFDKTVALCQGTQQSETVGTAQVNGCLVDLCVSLCRSYLVRHNQHRTNDTVMILPTSVVLPCQPKHRDRSSAPGTIKRSAVLSCPVLEVPIMLRHRFVLQSETRSCIGVETTSERVSGQCVGWAQGLSLGTKVLSSQCCCGGCWKSRSTCGSGRTTSVA